LQEADSSSSARYEQARKKYFDELGREAAAIKALPVILDDLRASVGRCWRVPMVVNGGIMLIAILASAIFCSGRISRLKDRLSSQESSIAAILQAARATSDRLATIELANAKTLPASSGGNQGLPLRFNGPDGHDYVAADNKVYDSDGRYFIEVYRRAQ
jgi:hypothetical protein